MKNLIHWLEALNRKERFYVLANALQGDVKFALHPRFLGALSQELQIDVPENAFAAMDYQLDWLFAALTLANGSAGGSEIAEREFEIEPPEDGKHLTVTGTHEDIDFLVAFEDPGVSTHVILIEAKGDGAWDNEQMRSKVQRLARFFGDDPAQDYPGIPGLTPHLVLLSPGRSENLEWKKWNCPDWMCADVTPRHHMELRMPSGLHLVERCNHDGDEGRWTHWKLVPRRGKRPLHAPLPA